MVEKNGSDEDLLLVVKILADAFGDGDGGAFQLQHAQRDAVHVDYHIRAFVMSLGIRGSNGDFLGNGKVILLRIASN
jgi:hypothetical protein